MADLPGGASGLLARDYKGKNAERLVTRIDPGVVPLVARTPRSRAADRRGIGRWKACGGGAQGDRRLAGGDYDGDAADRQELDSLEKMAGDGEIARGGRPGGSDVASIIFRAVQASRTKLRLPPFPFCDPAA